MPICKRCHMRHHDEGELKFTIVDDEVLWSTGVGWHPVSAYDETRQAAVTSDEESLSEYSREFGDILTLKNTSEYLIASFLAEMRESVPDSVICDWLADAHGFSRGSCAGYLRKNALYGSLAGHGVENLGITRGYEVARICEAGHRLKNVMHDYATMPREQFLEEYK